jgi:hypothetical protein
MGRSPVRNPRAGNVALTFSQAISAGMAGNIRIHSQQRAGQGTMSGDGGTSRLMFAPATDFRPGEMVFVTMPPTGGQVANRHVYQLTAPCSNTELAVGNAANGVQLGDIDGDLDIVFYLTRASRRPVE